MTRPPLAEALRQVIETWRAIANDARPSGDCDLDMVVMARDGQYAETLTTCADELETLLRASSSVEASPQDTFKSSESDEYICQHCGGWLTDHSCAAPALRGEASPQDKKPWCQICGKETPVYCADCFEALRGEASPPEERTK